MGLTLARNVELEEVRVQENLVNQQMELVDNLLLSVVPLDKKEVHLVAYSVLLLCSV